MRFIIYYDDLLISVASVIRQYYPVFSGLFCWQYVPVAWALCAGLLTAFQWCWWRVLTQPLRRLRRENPKSPFIFLSERGGPMTRSTVNKLIERPGLLAAGNTRVTQCQRSWQTRYTTCSGRYRHRRHIWDHSTHDWNSPSHPGCEGY